MTDMRIPIIAIGNSKGIRLPKSILQEYGFQEALELELREGEIVLKPCSTGRAGWEEAFAQYGDGAADDGFLDVWPADEGDEWN